MLVEIWDHDRFLDLRPGLGLDPGGLFGDHRVRLSADTLLDHLDIDRIFLEPVVERPLEVELFRKTRLPALDIPLFGIAALWARIGNDRVYGVAAHVLDDFGDFVRIHDVGALLITHAALAVHYVVTFP